MTIFLWQWSASITNTILERKYESKKGIESQPVRYMCYGDTCVHTTVLSPISAHHRYKKDFPLIRSVRFFESWAILVLFSRIYYFCTYIWGSQGKWKTLGSLLTKKRKKEMILNCCNLKCFKTKYQLLKSIIQTLF